MEPRTFYKYVTHVQNMNVRLDVSSLLRITKNMTQSVDASSPYKPSQKNSKKKTKKMRRTMNSKEILRKPKQN